MTDIDVEDEETLLLVELSGIIDSNFFTEKQKSMKVLGIETENPILQLDNYIFTGEYEDFKGTEVIFEEIKDKDGETSLKYFGKTSKKLSMKRVFLQEKKMEDSAPTQEMSRISLSEKEDSSENREATSENKD